nr:hypothetical protein CFP56_67330 [Quercus suber]
MGSNPVDGKRKKWRAGTACSIVVLPEAATLAVRGRSTVLSRYTMGGYNGHMLECATATSSAWMVAIMAIVQMFRPTGSWGSSVYCVVCLDVSITRLLRILIGCQADHRQLDPVAIPCTATSPISCSLLAPQPFLTRNYVHSSSLAPWMFQPMGGENHLVPRSPGHLSCLEL